VLKEFRQFLFRGNVVDLAVAVVIGTAFGSVVSSLVANIFTPLIAAVLGEADFSQLTFTINGSLFRYGVFLNALIAFVSIAAVVFFLVVKPVNAFQDRLGIAKDDAPQPSDEAKLLAEIRDQLRSGRGGRGPT
jgi:large conductance mechanosensitive channel